MSPPNADMLLAARADEHQMILDELETLEYAPSALRDNEAAIKSLNEQINEATKQIAILHENTSAEHQDIAKLQNSAGRRMWVRIKGGGSRTALEKSLAKEEREFVEALEKEQKEEESRAVLETEKENLEAHVADLRQLADRHQYLKTKLDNLYSGLFEGFTPDYPHEDEAEEAVHVAEDANENFQAVVNRESQVLSLLASARKFLKQATEQLHKAQAWNYSSMAGSGVSAGENNEFVDAKAFVLRAQALVHAAKKKSPMVADISDVDVVPLAFFTNMFANGVSDAILADRIKKSLGSVEYGAQRVQNDLDQADNRLSFANSNLRTAVATLTKRRRELEEIRRTILDSMHTGQPLPKHYTEKRPVEHPNEELPAYEKVHSGHTPGLRLSVPSARSPVRGTSAAFGSLSAGSGYLAPSSPGLGAGHMSPTSPHSRPRPVSGVNGVNGMNPYASALLAHATGL